MELNPNIVYELKKHQSKKMEYVKIGIEKYNSLKEKEKKYNDIEKEGFFVCTHLNTYRSVYAINEKQAAKYSTEGAELLEKENEHLKVELYTLKEENKELNKELKKKRKWYKFR